MQNINTKFTNKSKKIPLAFRKYIFCIGNLYTPPVVGCFPKNIVFSGFFENLKRY